MSIEADRERHGVDWSAPPSKAGHGIWQCCCQSLQQGGKQGKGDKFDYQHSTIDCDEAKQIVMRRQTEINTRKRNATCSEK